MKKQVSLLLAAALCTLMLCGCWGGNKKDDSSSSSSSRPQSSSSGSALSEGESMLEEILPDMSSSSQSAPPDSGSMAEPLPNTEVPQGGMSSSSNEAGSQIKPMAAENWQTKIVNAENPLNGDFSVLTRKIKGYDDRRFDTRAAGALEKMLADAEAAGCPLYLVSAYRSVQRQKTLYEQKVRFYKNWNYTAALAYTQAARWVARPGESEHNLGLAADIVCADWYAHHDDLTNDFAQTPAYAWLAEHAADYGFILRYPADKTALTGIGWESWHYRYVGETAARYLTENGLCLEELPAGFDVAEI